MIQTGAGISDGSKACIIKAALDEFSWGTRDVVEFTPHVKTFSMVVGDNVSDGLCGIIWNVWNGTWVDWVNERCCAGDGGKNVCWENDTQAAMASTTEGGGDTAGADAKLCSQFTEIGKCGFAFDATGGEREAVEEIVDGGDRRAHDGVFLLVLVAGVVGGQFCGKNVCCE